MQDLEIDPERVGLWLRPESERPYTLIRVSDEHARAWGAALGLVVRRCYVTDAVLDRAVSVNGVSKTDVVAAKLPDPGATMAGDFGEILVYLYQGAREHPHQALGATKWRLKQDRTKPAPHSDVVHLVLPTWPAASPEDTLLCAEVKTKSTDGGTSPIKDAIQDSGKDRVSRLARTLVWLRERALTENLGDLQLAHLERFINGTEHPPARKRFRAVAVVSAALLDGELADAPTEEPTDYEVIVISVPELRDVYMAVFDAARQAIGEVANVSQTQPSTAV
jgi:hypothetical protein